MTREISRKAAVSDISETRKWCLAFGFDVFGFIYIYIRYACGASLFEKVGKMLRWEILIQRFKGCSFATVINARFKLRVVGCRLAGLRNKYFLPPLSFLRAGGEQRFVRKWNMRAKWLAIRGKSWKWSLPDASFLYIFLPNISEKYTYIHLVIPPPGNSTVPSEFLIKCFSNGGDRAIGIDPSSWIMLGMDYSFLRIEQGIRVAYFRKLVSLSSFSRGSRG